MKGNHRPIDRDFSDIVHGEDYEFRESNDASFAVHRIESLGRVSPPGILSKMSADQIVTLSGAASGFLAGVVVCPLDVVKTRFQAQGLYKKGSIEARAKYSSFLGAFKTILRDEGIRGLYRGLIPITIGYLPTWTIYFSVYERAKRFYPSFIRKHLNIHLETLDHFASALTAGAVSSIAVNPIWVVKTRLMIQTGQGSTIYDSKEKQTKTQVPGTKHRTYYNGTVDAFRQMHKEEGFRVFYSGLVPSLFGLLHVGIHFPVYEKLKALFKCEVDVTQRSKESKHNSTSILIRLIVASAISKMIASTVTYPHEILRTRMQIRTSSQRKAKDTPTLIESTKSIYRTDGIKGFYAGYLVNLARTVPASAVTLVSFEYFKTYLLEISGKGLESRQLTS